MSQSPGFTHLALTVTDLPRSTALDHVALNCAGRTGLEKWGSRLDELGVSHGGIIDAHYGSGLALRDPDGIALEFFAPPS